MLWICVGFPCRRRTEEGGGRIRLERDRRLDVCDGGRALLLVCGLVFNPNRTVPKCAWTRLTIDIYGVSGGARAKCAGGIDEEYLIRYDVWRVNLL